MLVRDDWILYFKNMLAIASNGKMKIDQKQTNLSTAGGGGDMVIRYRREGYFKVTSAIDKSEKHICIAPELPSLFIVEDLNSLYMQAQVNSRSINNNNKNKNNKSNNGKRKDEESDDEEEEEEEKGNGWKCNVM